MSVVAGDFLAAGDFFDGGGSVVAGESDAVGDSVAACGSVVAGDSVAAGDSVTDLGCRSEYLQFLDSFGSDFLAIVFVRL